MAFITLKNGTGRSVSYVQALRIQEVQQGMRHGTPSQKVYAKQVKKIYFGKQHSVPEREVVQARLPYVDK